MWIQHLGGRMLRYTSLMKQTRYNYSADPEPDLLITTLTRKLFVGQKFEYRA